MKLRNLLTRLPFFPLVNAWRCQRGLNPIARPREISPSLRSFLTSYLQWAEDGAESARFSRACGLCRNAERFCGVRTWDELGELLAADFWDSAYPFGGTRRYTIDSAREDQHTNQMRLSWIRQVIGDA